MSISYWIPFNFVFLKIKRHRQPENEQNNSHYLILWWALQYGLLNAIKKNYTYLELNNGVDLLIHDRLLILILLITILSWDKKASFGLKSQKQLHKNQTCFVKCCARLLRMQLVHNCLLDTSTTYDKTSERYNINHKRITCTPKSASDSNFLFTFVRSKFGQKRETIN